MCWSVLDCQHVKKETECAWTLHIQHGLPFKWTTVFAQFTLGQRRCIVEFSQSHHAVISLTECSWIASESKYGIVFWCILFIACLLSFIYVLIWFHSTCIWCNVYVRQLWARSSFSAEETRVTRVTLYVKMWVTLELFSVGIAPAFDSLNISDYVSHCLITFHSSFTVRSRSRQIRAKWLNLCSTLADHWCVLQCNNRGQQSHCRARAESLDPSQFNCFFLM